MDFSTCQDMRFQIFGCFLSILPNSIRTALGITASVGLLLALTGIASAQQSDGGAARTAPPRFFDIFHSATVYPITLSAASSKIHPAGSGLPPLTDWTATMAMSSVRSATTPTTPRVFATIKSMPSYSQAMERFGSALRLACAYLTRIQKNSRASLCLIQLPRQDKSL